MISGRDLAYAHIPPPLPAPSTARAVSHKISSSTFRCLTASRWAGLRPHRAARSSL